MAENHLQVNSDASTALRKTSLWPSEKKSQEEIIKTLFEHNNWKVLLINNVSGAHWKIITQCQNVEWKINLYISSIRDERRKSDEYKMQLGNTYPTSEEPGWINLVLGIYQIENEQSVKEYILSGYDIKRYDFSSNPSIRGTRTEGLQKAKINGMFKTDKSILFRPEFIYYYLYEVANSSVESYLESPFSENTEQIVQYNNYFTALRTKPFLLLAGISGTGKSRIVRELAFMTCPEYLQDENKTTPGNYCIIEVKPNWHDSTELVGYWSNINKQYMFPKFVKFLVKAKMYPQVPFFICLDEMNLAPVEQYFAEILSALETRLHPRDKNGNVSDSIKTSSIVESKYFKNLVAIPNTINRETGEPAYTSEENKEIYKRLWDLNSSKNELRHIDEQVGSATTIFSEGLTLPDNIFIIGTVNMDDTTHQFSRKVIDRAMTIEMNGGTLEEIFNHESQLTYRKEADIIPINKLAPRYVSAGEAIRMCESIRNNINFETRITGKDTDGNIILDSLPKRLEQINTVLQGTPFTVSYRVMNELVILLAVLLDEATENGGRITDDVFNRLMETAIDRILLMKILPRVEGDDEMFRISPKERRQYNLNENITEDGETYDFTKLDWLRAIAPQFTDTFGSPMALEERIDEENNKHEAKEKNTTRRVYTAADKLDEMIERLRRQNFTRYWP